jgi:hypothetical protein
MVSNGDTDSSQRRNSLIPSPMGSKTSVTATGAVTTPRGSHTPTCATGARAETRGPCDCGATGRPYRCRLGELDNTGKHLVVVEADGPLTTAETCLFALQLLELCRTEGERWAREQGRKR